MNNDSDKRFPWIYDRIKSTKSQCGEDSVIEAIFEKIGTTNKNFVDLGAYDPVRISNSFNFISEKSWPGVLIESNIDRFQKCENYYKDRNDVACINKKVDRSNTLDDILDEIDFPDSYDVLSIDIDSIDYFVWSDHIRRPRVVIIECNPSIDTDISFIQRDFSQENIGNSARALVDLGREKGYELVAHLLVNCIFVVKEEFSKLEIEDNSLERLFTSPFVPRVISDLRGNHYLIKPGVWGYRSVTGLDNLSHNDGYDSSISMYNSINHEMYDIEYSSKIGNFKYHNNWNVVETLTTFINSNYNDSRDQDPPWKKKK